MSSMSFHMRAAGYCAVPAADRGVKRIVSRNICSCRLWAGALLII